MSQILKIDSIVLGDIPKDKVLGLDDTLRSEIGLVVEKLFKFCVGTILGVPIGPT